MSLQIEGAATQHLTPFERNKYARGLDYVGYVPGLGSVGGVARLISGIAAMIFFSIEASKVQSTDKQKLLMYRTVAGHEALRGLLEITWIGNLVTALILESEVDSNSEFFPRINSDLQSDRAYKESQEKNEPIEGIIALPFSIAHGKYFYKDSNPRCKDHIHYSNFKYADNQVIWKTLVRQKAIYRDGTIYGPGLLGTCGIVLKQGYIAKETETARFTVIKMK